MKKTVTLPKQYWVDIVSLADDIEAGISDALFMLVDLGLKAMKNEEAMSLLVGSDEEEEEDDDLEEEEDEEED